MARFNQSSGRTPEAWKRRYEARLKGARKVAGRLGGSLEVGKCGGPGVPGGCGNYLVIVMPNGERLGRRQAAKLARSRGLIK